MKRFISLTTGFIIIFAGVVNMFSSSTKCGAEKASVSVINNAALMPQYVTDSNVVLEVDGSPDWVKTLIMAEVRIKTATEQGTLQSAIKVLDHYAEMGVNGLWITPVYDPGKNGNGYDNFGPHTIDPAITCTTDYSEGWKVLKDFINEAHKRNIRIILDVISWGTAKDSSLKTEHPDWYTGKELWGGYAFNWGNSEFKKWYIEQITNIGMTTGCDGFRYDVEPRYAGYEVHEEIRQHLLDNGRKLVMISEDMNERRNSYNFEQFGVRGWLQKYRNIIPEYTFLDDGINIVDSIKNGVNIGLESLEQQGKGGNFRYYTNMLSCHDNVYTVVNGNKVAMGYTDIFSPFIPLWYIGEEWNNPYDIKLPAKGNCLYFSEIDWDSMNKAENRSFYEDVKAMIRIRRQYPEVFAYSPSSIRDTNICKVAVDNSSVQAYARYNGDLAFIIVPNNTDSSANLTVHIPFENCNLENYRNYVVTDAETNVVIASGSSREIEKLTINVEDFDQKVLKITATNSGIFSDELDLTYINTNNLSIYSSGSGNIIKKGYWTSHMKLTNNSYGGVKFDYTNGQSDIRDGYKYAVCLDGLKLQFDNLTRKDVSSGKFSVVIGNRYGVWSPQYSDDTPPLAVNLDPNAGTLSAFPGNFTIITSNILKYENLTGKPFSYRIRLQKSGIYQLEIEIDGEKITGEIPDAAIKAASNLNPTDCYTSITSWDTAQNFSVDFTSISTGNILSDASVVENTIDKITNANANKGSIILKAYKLFNNLSDTERVKVRNLNVLFNALTSYNELCEKENSEYTVMSKQNALLSAQRDNSNVESTLASWSEYWMSVSDIKNGGLRYNFTDSFRDVYEGYGKTVELDGLLLQFNNLNRKNNHSGKLAMLIGNDGSNYGITYGDDANHALTVVLDTTKGTIKAEPDGTVIIRDDSLKYENIKDKRFSLQFLKRTDNSFLLQFYSEGTLLAGIIKEEIITNAKKLTNTSSCNISLTSWALESDTVKQSFSVDFTGIGKAYELGDINGDKTIDIKDLVCLKKFICNFDCNIKGSASDINIDGNVNSIDTAMLKKELIK